RHDPAGAPQTGQRPVQVTRVVDVADLPAGVAQDREVLDTDIHRPSITHPRSLPTSRVPCKARQPEINSCRPRRWRWSSSACGRWRTAAVLRFPWRAARIPRREELAQLACISVEYYQRLEQGRATRPSDEVLDAIAQVLSLDAVERAYLDSLAHPPTRPVALPTAGEVRPELQRMLTLIDRIPALIKRS
ncbi:MAG: putative DNA-binding protein, partial [Actinomycetia bacterium]|nr:putative DNA-binding protein [Actinomycetes bacterium]